MFLTEHAGSGKHRRPDREEEPQRRSIAGVAQRHILHVTQKRQQEEQTCSDVGSADNPRHRLGMDWMRREQGSSDERRERPAQGDTRQMREHPCDKRVEENIPEVVSPGVQAVQVVVQAESEDAQRSVGLVRATVRERGSPEVVIKEVDERCLR